MPSGDALLLVTEVLPAGEIAKREMIRFSIKDSVITQIPAPAHGAWGNVVLSPDGSSIAYASARVDGPVPHDLYLQPLGGLGGEGGVGGTAGAKNLTEQSLDLPVHYGKFVSNHSLLFAVQKGFASRLYSITDKGEATPYGLDRQVGAFDVSDKGDLVFESFDATHLPEIWLAGSDKKPVQVSHFNKAFDSLRLVAPTLITYKSFDGTPIEAALYKPAGNAGGSGKLLPLVVYIHGGPTGAFSDSYSAWAQLFVQKGYAVFCPNIRGSTGYGWKFLAANRNDWGGGDFKDIMAGVDMLIAKENIDPARMGISGWSYGGYMAEWAITQTNRFKASMSGAGLANLASEFGTEGGPEYDQWFFGTPYEHPENFTKHSPFTYIKNAKTPTLIIQGENDQTDPIGQSQELYRGLRYYHVPAELVVYPREPHGFREIKHNIDFYTRMLAWFDKYVL
jgi:dipeptidyl aminopeptidase/acylaminoacyl peptidase